MFTRLRFSISLMLVLLFSPQWSLADVVKPALIEISIHTDGTYHIEVRASIEALLTGIGAQYKNTKDAPNADDYDKLRILTPEKLETAFEPFAPKFAAQVEVLFDLCSCQ